MLSSCLYCGAQISVSATVCPKCKEDTPLGFKCVFCQQRGRRDQVTLSVGSPHPHRQIYSHESCLARYFSVPEGFTCPECHAVLVGKTTRRPLAREMSSACPKCGYPSLLPASSSCCVVCGLPLYKALGQKRVTLSYGCVSATSSTPGEWAHTFCTNAPRQFSREQTIKLFASILIGSVIGIAVWPIAPTSLRIVLVLLAFPVVFLIVCLLCMLFEKKDEEEA